MSDASRDNGCDELYIPMGGVMFWFLFSTLLMGVCGFLIYLYYLKKGQFEEMEDVKYQMFREDEEGGA